MNYNQYMNYGMRLMAKFYALKYQARGEDVQIALDNFDFIYKQEFLKPTKNGKKLFSQLSDRDKDTVTGALEELREKYTWVINFAKQAA